MGGFAEMTLNGSSVAGAVLAVKEDASGIPTQWIITIAATREGAAV
jgi:hypothetical protein